MCAGDVASSSSFSVAIEVEVEGVGKLRGELKRYLSPMTVDEVVKRLPLSGVAAMWDNAMYMQVEMRRGAEKPARSIEPGDILYWPPSSAIVFVFKPGPPPPQSVKIGKLLDEPTKLESTRPGCRVAIRRAEQR